MYYLCSKERIVHLDIKPSNILFDENGDAFIADLGIARKIQNESLMRIKCEGTIDWMAPELRLVEGEISSSSKKTDYYKVDVFSLGLVTLYALDNENYSNMKSKYNSDKKQNKGVKWLNHDEQLLKNYLMDLKEKIPDQEFFEVLCTMLKFDYKERKGLKDLYIWMVRNFI